MTTPRDEWNRSEGEVAGIGEELRNLREKAPGDLCGKIMQRLPERRPPIVLRPVWWGRAALIGAAAAVLVLFAVLRTDPEGRPAVTGATVRFEYHAPAASQVELVGSFNHWRVGEIALAGPDAAGHWHADVPLPDGEHEYLFHVDGQEWVADPGASFFRPDGFGSRNALLYVTHRGDATRS